MDTTIIFAAAFLMLSAVARAYSPLRAKLRPLLRRAR